MRLPLACPQNGDILKYVRNSASEQSLRGDSKAFAPQYKGVGRRLACQQFPAAAIVNRGLGVQEFDGAASLQSATALWVVNRAVLPVGGCQRNASR